MKDKSLAVILPWRDRPELLQTIQANLGWLRTFSDKIVIVNCGGSSQWLRDNLAPIGGVQTIVLELPAETFNKSLAINLGLSLADTELVFILDVDVIVDDFFPAAFLLCDGSACVTLQRIRESAPGAAIHSELAELTLSLRLKTSNSDVATVETSHISFAEGTRSAPGILLAAREHLIETGGLNSNLLAWGWEDVDLLVRLQLKCRLRHHQTGRGIHISHGDDLRYFGPFNSRAESEQRNSQLCLSRYHSGNLEGTLREDLIAWQRLISAWSI
jgi:hypothetical protein